MHRDGAPTAARGAAAAMDQGKRGAYAHAEKQRYRKQFRLIQKMENTSFHLSSKPNLRQGTIFFAPRWPGTGKQADLDWMEYGFSGNFPLSLKKIESFL